MRIDKIGKSKVIATFIIDKTAKILYSIYFPFFFLYKTTSLCFGAVSEFHFHYASSFHNYFFFNIFGENANKWDSWSTKSVIWSKRFSIRFKRDSDHWLAATVPLLFLWFKSVIWNGWKGKENVATINRSYAV